MCGASGGMISRLASAQNPLLAGDDEAQRTALKHADLFVGMAVHGDHGALPQPDARHRHMPPMNHPAAKQGIERLLLQHVPVVMLHCAVLYHETL